MLDQPRFPVGAGDVFPEEFPTYLRSPPMVGEVFVEHDPEIGTLSFWQSMKRRDRAGDIFDFFPYPASVRLHQDRPPVA